jgi:hypothetical protein
MTPEEIQVREQRFGRLRNVLLVAIAVIAALLLLERLYR